MTKVSSKHHYLPQCYLKGFRSPADELYVYDKQETRFFMTTKTRDVFHENHRNSFTNPKTKERIDLLERLYVDFDGQLATLLRKVVDSTTETSPLTDEEKLEFLLALSLLFWRVPARDARGRELMRTMGFDNGVFGLIDTKTGKPINEEIARQVLEFDGMEGVYKLLLSFAPFHKRATYQNAMHIRVLYQDPGFYITGDNPILKRDAPTDLKDILDEFMFPVASNRLLICSKDFMDQSSLPEAFCFDVGVAIIDQAQRFVCARDGEYLKMLVGLHSQTSEIAKRSGFNLADYLFRMRSAGTAYAAN